MDKINAGDTAWVLASAGLVLLMTPGLALFYGGMVRARTVLNMMLMSFSAIAVVAIAWTVGGYSIAFGTDIGGLLGNPLDHLGLAGTDEQSLLGGSGVPFLVAAGFQMTFAIISTALMPRSSKQSSAASGSSPASMTTAASSAVRTTSMFAYGFSSPDSRARASSAGLRSASRA